MFSKSNEPISVGAAGGFKPQRTRNVASAMVAVIKVESIAQCLGFIFIPKIWWSFFMIHFIKLSFTVLTSFYTNNPYYTQVFWFVVYCVICDAMC